MGRETKMDVQASEQATIMNAQDFTRTPPVRCFHFSAPVKPCSGGRHLALAAVAAWLLISHATAQTVVSTGAPGDTSPAANNLTAERIAADSGCHGGLIVQVGCHDATLALCLAKKPNILVHALVDDRDELQRIRRQIRDGGVYGRVSAISWKGPFLPYADGMVNVLLVLDEGATLEPKEIDRVLAPLGAAWIKRDGAVAVHQKPWPIDVDEWSHARYDATGNAVSTDRFVGPPRFLQWEATPRWNRGVKTSGLVSARGRLFFILDDSHFATRSSSWSLIARDASNGIQLWRHELPSWGGARGGKKVGPAQMNRRLVALGDRVYATLAEFAPVSVLDAATGEVIRALEQTDPAEEFILSDGVVVALVNPNSAADHRRGREQKMRLVAVEPESGKLLWQRDAAMVLPLTMAADGKQAVFHDGKAIQSLELTTGKPRWTSPPTGQKVVYRDQANPDSPGAEKSTIVLAPQFAPTLIIYGDVVAFAGGCQVNVVSAYDGRGLWHSGYAATNYSVPVDLFGFGGCLWGPDAKMNLWRPLDDDISFNAYDPLTGEVKKSIAGKYNFRFQHHRCHQMKVVGDTVIAARAGVEFLDTGTGDVAAHHWTRGSCYYGILPANGRLYTPPHDCACYVRAKVSGFLAMNSVPSQRSTEISNDRRLERGEAYGQTAGGEVRPGPEEWPTYRHDAGRSGRTNTAVDAELLLGWQTPLGGKLTSPVIANNRVYLASTDAHTLHVLDATTGERLWQSTFDARIDSPPTIHEGLVLCGCRDGSVHALRAADGALVWRFVASPDERLIVARGQLESVWPVSGSVLVAKSLSQNLGTRRGQAHFAPKTPQNEPVPEGLLGRRQAHFAPKTPQNEPVPEGFGIGSNDLAWCAAGRSSYLDGGIRLYGLEPHTGRKVAETVLCSRHADGSELLDDQGVDGYLNDILSSDGQRMFMRHQVFDMAGNPRAERVAHLHGPDGYLSSDTTHRFVWTYAPLYTSPHQGAFYDLRLSRVLFPSGRILVEDDDTIYGFGQNHYHKPIAEPGGQWALFAAAKQIDVPLDLSAKEYRTLALSGKKSVQFRWWKPLPIQAWAMVKTENVLFVAGPHGSAATSEAALAGEAPASLLAVSPADGSVLAEMTLPAAPVWDGMAAAAGNLYIALASGDVLCLWSCDSGRPGTPLSAAAWRAALPPLETAPEPGLVGHWRFDEGAGMLARDCSGRGNDAELSGRWVKDDGKTCLEADSVPGAAVIPDSPDFHFGNDDFTLALCLKFEQYGVRLVGKEAFPENWWVINVLDNGRAELVLGEGRGPGHSVRPTTEASLATDAWTHLVAVADRKAREVRWYVNGKLDSRHPIPETMTKGLHAAGREIAIPSSHKPFRGLIGDFRIYRQAITAECVQELYQQETAQTKPGAP